MNKNHCLFLLLVTSIFRQVTHAVTPAGTVIGWGNNLSGTAIGVPSPEQSCYATGTVKIAGQILSNAVAVSAGNGHGLALKVDGTVVGWGDNTCGEAIGIKTESPYRTNGQVILGGSILTNITAVCAGNFFSLAIKKDGSVVSWGEETKNAVSCELKVPSDASNIVAITAGLRSRSALRKDGTLIEWGVNGNLGILIGMSNLIAIASGTYDYGRNLGLTRGGAFITWDSGDETLPPPGPSNTVAIAVGYNHSLALQADGSVFGWGGNGGGEATGIPTLVAPYSASGFVTVNNHCLTNIVGIATGNGFSMALKTDGTVITWGRMKNGLYPATVPFGLSNVVAIAAGNDFCLAITTNKAVADQFRH